MLYDERKKKKDRLTYLSLATLCRTSLLSRRHSFSYIKFIAILIILRTRPLGLFLKSSETGTAHLKCSVKQDGLVLKGATTSAHELNIVFNEST